MNAITMNDAAPQAGALSRIRSALLAGRAYRRAYSRTRSELLDLSRRDLADIGIHACDIEDVARAAGEQARAACQG